jgi:hypothetical protein
MKRTLTPITLNPPTGGDPRSEGIHISKVIKAIAAESRILKPEYVESLDLVEVSGASALWWKNLSVENQIRIAIGLAWDEWYLPNLGTIVPHPGEMQIDGLFMTPDGESLDIVRVGLDVSHQLAIHEVKATYKSVNTVGDLSGEWMWLTQMKCYCKGAGTNIGYLHPLHLCGDYSRPITPQIGPVKGQMCCHRLEFSDEEIEDTWDLVTGYVRHRQRLDYEQAMQDTEEL